jgi:alanine dehydrogenase
MIIGVPKEIKKLEYRVGLTPAAAKTYMQVIKFLFKKMQA